MIDLEGLLSLLLQNAEGLTDFGEMLVFFSKPLKNATVNLRPTVSQLSVLDWEIYSNPWEVYSLRIR